MTDKLGRQIKPGDFIAYAIKEGDTPGLRIAKVLRVNDKGGRFTLTVIGLSNYYDSPRLLEKQSTLQYTQRCIVLQPETIPVELIQLLNGEQSETY